MSEIVTPGDYVITRTDKQGIKIEQVVKIRFPENNGVYNFDYGYNGYHEGYCKKEEIRELTHEEKIKCSQGKYYDLPQQFYQS